MALNLNNSNQPTILQVVPALAVCATFLYHIFLGYGLLKAFFCLLGLIGIGYLIMFLGQNKMDKTYLIHWSTIVLLFFTILIITHVRKIEKKDFEIRELQYRNDFLVANNNLTSVKSKMESLTKEHKGALSEIGRLNERNRYQLDSIDRAVQDELTRLNTKHEAELTAISTYTEEQMKALKSQQTLQRNKLIKSQSEREANIKALNKVKLNALNQKVFDLEQKLALSIIKEDSIITANATLSEKLGKAETQIVKMELAQITQIEQHKSEVDSLKEIITVYSEKEKEERAFLLCKSGNDYFDKALDVKNSRYKEHYLIESKKAYLAAMETGVYDDAVILKCIKPVLKELDKYDKDDLVNQTLPIKKMNQKQKMVPVNEKAAVN